MDEIGIEEARGQLGYFIDRARFLGHHVTLTRHGKPVAVIVSAEWYADVEKDIHLLRADYIVGHRDGDPTNNDPANLEIIKRPS